jgi:hypothetical protein
MLHLEKSDRKKTDNNAILSIFDFDLKHEDDS